ERARLGSLAELLEFVQADQGGTPIVAAALPEDRRGLLDVMALDEDCLTIASEQGLGGGHPFGIDDLDKVAERACIHSGALEPAHQEPGLVPEIGGGTP